jgi:sporulation integral membrane protein YlbJ
MFFLAPEVIIKGISNGLTLCAVAVIPPIFPFMILSDFIIRSGLSDLAGRFLFPVTRFLFRLPGSTGCAVLMSMVGGYPVGMKMIAQLVECGDISEKQGRRMTLFCVNAGPAFVIGTVGAVFYSDKKVGIILYISLILSSLMMGVASRFIDNQDYAVKKKTKNLDLSVFGQSVMQSTESILSLCAWVIIFSGMVAIISWLPIGENKLLWLMMITEVTGGCKSAVGIFPHSIQALVLGWAGLSVHCQLYPFIKSLNIKYSYFAFSRLIHAGLSATVADVLFRIFPIEEQVFSTGTAVMPEVFSVSVPAGVAMLFLASFMIIDMPFSKSLQNKTKEH